MPNLRVKTEGENGFDAYIDDRATAVFTAALLDYSTTVEIAAAYAPIVHTHAIADVTGLQTALDAKQNGDSDLTAIAALTTTGVARRTGAGTWDTISAARTDVTNTFTASQLIQAAATGTTSLMRIINSNSGQPAILRLEAPGWQIAFQTNPSNGWFEIASSSGAIQHRWFEKRYMLASDGSLEFSSETNYATAGATGDVSLRRSGFEALIVRGTSSNNGDLTVRNMTMTGLAFLGSYTFGTLPSAAANTRGCAVITDCNTTTNGANAAAGGGNVVLVFSNGSNWKVAVG